MDTKKAKKRIQVLCLFLVITITIIIKMKNIKTRLKQRTAQKGHKNELFSHIKKLRIKSEKEELLSMNISRELTPTISQGESSSIYRNYNQPIHEFKIKGKNIEQLQSTDDDIEIVASQEEITEV